MPISRLALIFFLTTAHIALLAEGVRPARAETPPGSVPGAVMIVDGRLNNDVQRIESVDVQAGLLPRSTGTKSSAGAYRLDVVSTDGSVLYSEFFNFPPYIQVPPARPDLPDDIPGVVEPAEKEIGLVIPYFSDAEYIQVTGPDKSAGDPFYIQHPADLGIPPDFLDKAASDYGTLHILIMAGGYSNMAPFNTMAENVKSTMLSKAPFNTRTGDISFHIHQNTASLGCAPGCSGISRLLCCSSSAVMSAAAASGYKYDEIIVLHNTATYSGGGYRDLGSYQSNSYSSYSADYHGSYTPIMSVHEFGHSFGNLCDEYTYGSEGYSYYSCVNCLSSCSAWSSITSGCNQGCDARPAFYRPEGSVMLSFNFNTFNIPSRSWSLEPRLEFFAGPATTPVNYDEVDLAVEAVTPRNGSSDVAINQPVSVRFTKPMETSTLPPNFKLTKTSDGIEVAGSMQVSSFGVSFFAGSDLENRTSYTASVWGAGVQDAWGNALGDDYEWSFTTGDQYLSIPSLYAWGSAIAGLLLAASGFMLARRRKV